MSGPVNPLYGVEQGDHACVTYAGADERRALWAAHLTAAIERGERAVFIGDGGWPPGPAGPGAAVRADRGQLAVRPAHEAGLSAGRFDAGRLVGLLHRQAEQAARLGLRGLRVCIDLTGLLQDDRPTGDGCLPAAVCAAQARPPALICHGDADRLTGPRLGDVTSRHPLSFEAAALLRRGPLLCAVPLRDPAGLRLTGEIDRSNLARFEAALAAAPWHGTDLHLDVRGLRHADVAAVRLLVRTAGELPAGGRLVLHAPGPVLRAVLGAFGWHDRLVVEEGDRG